jgi:hypothetical protein
MKALKLDVVYLGAGRATRLGIGEACGDQLVTFLGNWPSRGRVPLICDHSSNVNGFFCAVNRFP